MDASIRMRQAIEKEIAKCLIYSLVAAGFAVSVNNGGDEDEIKPTRVQSDILGAMFGTDDETVIVWDETGTKRAGWIHLVYGNDGWDVISDYNIGIASHLERANKMADDIESGRYDITLLLHPQS